MKKVVPKRSYPKSKNWFFSADEKKPYVAAYAYAGSGVGFYICLYSNGRCDSGFQAVSLRPWNFWKSVCGMG